MVSGTVFKRYLPIFNCPAYEIESDVNVFYPSVNLVLLGYGNYNLWIVYTGLNTSNCQNMRPAVYGKSLRARVKVRRGV